MKKNFSLIFISVILMSFLLPIKLNAQTQPASNPSLLQRAGDTFIDLHRNLIPGFSTAEKAVKGTVASAECFSNMTQCIQLIFVTLIQWIGNLILSLVSTILWFGGMIFNLSIYWFVVNMKTAITNIPVIFTVWQTVRDLANMFFIFLLLYIAIQTILGITKNYIIMLRNVVVVALFINFSFFATGLLIDASNLVALQFYDGFSTTDCAFKPDSVGVVALADGCMSYKVVQAVSLQTIYTYDKNKSNWAGAGEFALALIPGVGVGVAQLGAIVKMVVAVVMGSTLMIILATIFIASALLIFYRFVTLIFLLMLSPLAFALSVVPTGEKHWKEWWTRLTTQLIFAPVYFMFLWIVMTIITATDSKGNGVLQTLLGAKDASFLGMADGAASTIGLIANYIIVVLMLSFSLILANKLGATGAKQALQVSKNLQAVVARNTVGRLASATANTNAMRNFRRDNPTLGRWAQAPLNAVAGYGFGGAKGGYKKAQENYVKGEEAFAKTLGPRPTVTRNADIKFDEADTRFKNGMAALNPEFKVANENLAAAEREQEEAVASNDIVKGGEATQKVNEAKAVLAKLEERKKALKDARDRAQDEIDLLKGVDDKEIEKRAKQNVDERAKTAGYTDQQKKEEVKKETQVLKEKYKADKYKGEAKINREIFGKNIEKGLGVITSVATLVEARNAVDKLNKGKNKTEQLLDDIIKEAGGKKDEGEEEGGGGGEKPEKKDKPAEGEKS